MIPESPVLEQGQIRIRKRGAERIRNGHLWVYRSDILEVRDVPAGAITVVRDEHNAVVGKAFYSTQSQIALRFLVRGDVVIDEAFLRRRFVEADNLRLRLGVDPSVSRRIYSEADLLPGLIVDRYNEYLVVQSLTQAADRLQPRFISILQDLYQPRSILVRNDSKVRELEGLPLEQTWIGEDHPESVVVDEDGKQVEIPLASGLRGLRGQKTGSYLDQRENHRAARRYARGRALDGFCYGGGFALQLADVCDHVDAVDSSPAAVQLAQSNAERNGLPNITCIEANVFDFLRERAAQIRKGEGYDTIVLDPPAFARNKESLEGAIRGYKEINHRAMRLLKDGGILITSSCSYHVNEGLFAEILAEAARDAGCWLRVLERRIQAADHPVLMAVPETLYLKCFILEVMY